ncbi:MAG: hypothetical protein IPP88_13095 [Betaproteobacteria bacterium]|nr:hypothetical protein [Betaproteobacteria bacterium]
MTSTANPNVLVGVGTAPLMRPLRATVFALAIAAALLVVAILPAEFGIDLTGMGRLLGLTAMGERKAASTSMPIAPPSTVPASPVPNADAAGKEATSRKYATVSALPLRFDEIEVKLAPNGQIEYKALMDEGEMLAFAWDAGGANVKFDFHGEPTAGPDGAFISFEKGTAAKSGGSLKAPFAGTHGWWWKNPTQKDVVIKLRVSGFYANIKQP